MRRAIAACPLQPGRLMGYNDTNVSPETGLLGSEWLGYSNNMAVVYKVVKNASTGTMVSRDVVKFSTTAGSSETHVADQCGAVGRWAGVVADGYPSSGVPVGEYFLLVTAGPTLVKTMDSAVIAFAAGDVLVPAASGRVDKQDLTGATAPLGNQIQNRLGRAMSAATTSQTATAVLVNLTRL